MNRYTIEKRDKEVVEKFRAVVASKAQRKKMARIKLFSVLLVFGCGGLIFLYKQFTLPPVPPPSVYKSNIIVLNRVDDGYVPPQNETDIQSPGPDEIQIAVIEKQFHSKSLDPKLHSVEQFLPEKMMPRESVPVLKPRVKTAGKVGISEVPKQISAETDIRIAEIITCQVVKNKRAVSRQNVFSLQKGATPYVWMDVRSEKTPYQLRHIYYLNGRRYCEVPLAIHYPRMRTWSNVTLRHQYETGHWRVDVVTRKGEILSQAEFTVVP